MSTAHKAALAEGRTQSRAVRVYLEALEANKPKRGRKRTADSVQHRLDAVVAELEDASALDRLHLLQEQANLTEELGSMSAESNLDEYEQEFIAAAAGYSERKGITYDTWRAMGVQPSVLRAAGIGRS